MSHFFKIWGAIYFLIQHFVDVFLGWVKKAKLGKQILTKRTENGIYLHDILTKKMLNLGGGGKTIYHNSINLQSILIIYTCFNL